MEKKAPTIKSIAMLLKVSTATVSRALSDHPYISSTTKKRVREMAEKMQYTPNTLAISFKKNKTFIIGVVIPFIKEGFFSEAISGIEAIALEKNYTILFGQSYDNPVQERKVIEVMRRQRIDGLIISLSKTSADYSQLKELEQRGMPVVFFDRVPKDELVHKVSCNLFKGTIEMINCLFGKGYKRIALINGPEKLSASKERLKGYIEGISRKKVKVDMQMVVNTDLSAAETEKAIRSLLALKKRPDAIISFNDYVHMDAVKYAFLQDVRVNREIAFVSYANLPITSYTAFPPLISLEQYPYSQGEKAMQILIKILEEKSSDDEPVAYCHEELDPTVVIHSFPIA